MSRGTSSGKREGAVQSRTRFVDIYQAWLRHHRISAADSLQRLLDKPWSSILTWLVIAIAMALPVGMSVAVENAQSISTSWDRPAQISLFLTPDIETSAAKEYQSTLDEHEAVVSTRLITSEEALAEFRQHSGLGDLLDSLDKNPLPTVIIVTPAENIEGDSLHALLLALQDMPPVDEAVLDMEWVARLAGIMNLVKRAVYAVGSLLVLGVVLILGNTIRLAIENRRDEIVIVKLIGGSNAFVRRPFLYTGLWYGVGGGLFAALLVSSSLWYLSESADTLAQLYQSGFKIQGLGIMGSLNMIVTGGFLGLAGAWAAVSSHLGEIEPR